MLIFRKKILSISFFFCFWILLNNNFNIILYFLRIMINLIRLEVFLTFSEIIINFLNSLNLIYISSLNPSWAYSLKNLLFTLVPLVLLSQTSYEVCGSVMVDFYLLREKKIIVYIKWTSYFTLLKPLHIRENERER